MDQPQTAQISLKNSFYYDCLKTGQLLVHQKKEKQKTKKKQIPVCLGFSLEVNAILVIVEFTPPLKPLLITILEATGPLVSSLLLAQSIALSTF